jgi:hypothetical protein
VRFRLISNSTVPGTFEGFSMKVIGWPMVA